MPSRAGRYLQNVDQLAVAPLLEVADRARTRLLRHALDDRLLQFGTAEAWRAEIVHPALHGRRKMVEEVLHPALSAGEMEGQARPHQGPAQAGAVGDGSVGIGDRDDALGDE